MGSESSESANRDSTVPPARTAAASRRATRCASRVSAAARDAASSEDPGSAASSPRATTAFFSRPPPPFFFFAPLGTSSSVSSARRSEDRRAPRLSAFLSSSPRATTVFFSCPPPPFFFFFFFAPLGKSSSRSSRASSNVSCSSSADSGVSAPASRWCLPFAPARATTASVSVLNAGRLPPRPASSAQPSASFEKRCFASRGSLSTSRGFSSAAAARPWNWNSGRSSAWSSSNPTSGTSARRCSSHIPRDSTSSPDPRSPTNPSSSSSAAERAPRRASGTQPARIALASPTTERVPSIAANSSS